LLLLLVGCASAEPLRGHVVDARPSDGMNDTPDTAFDVELVNHGARACTLTGYRVVWGSGIFAGRIDCHAQVVLMPGSSSRQTCVVRSRSPLGATPGLTDPPVVEIRGSCEAAR
jgi:hypothetical protein